MDKKNVSGCCVSSSGDECRASRGPQLLSAIAARLYSSCSLSAGIVMEIDRGL